MGKGDHHYHYKEETSTSRTPGADLIPSGGGGIGFESEWPAGAPAASVNSALSDSRDMGMKGQQLQASFNQSKDEEEDDNVDVNVVDDADKNDYEEDNAGDEGGQAADEGGEAADDGGDGGEAGDDGGDGDGHEGGETGGEGNDDDGDDDDDDW